MHICANNIDMTNVRKHSNCVDPGQTALIEQFDLGLQCLSKRLLKHSGDEQASDFCCNLRFCVCCNLRS